MASADTIVTLNVGGTLFQTTASTLSCASPSSPLRHPPPFLDRDPLLFSHLLSFLRSRRLPPTSLLPDLLHESLFYGLRHLLPLTPPSFLPFSLRPVSLLPLHGRDPPSSLSSSPSGSLHVSHSSKITSFDPSLLSRSTLLTPLPFVDHLLAFHPSLVAAGADDYPGLHVLDLHTNTHKAVLHWTSYPSPQCPKSTVRALAASPSFLFSSFDSCRRNANVISAYDINTLQPSVELGRQDAYGADADSGFPATKLRWVPSSGLLMASGSYGGPFGLVGNVRLWDVRSGKATWEVAEKEDCFADVAGSDALGALFKVGSRSGDVFMVDLRKMGGWVRLGGGRGNGGGNGGKGKEGVGCKMECYEDKVFCTRGGEVEMWSEVVMGEVGREDGLMEGERVMRRNVLGRPNKDGKRITGLCFGGNRMVLAREGEQHVEVWESPVKG